jgi:hypothetical protein
MTEAAQADAGAVVSICSATATGGRCRQQVMANDLDRP